MQMVVRASLLGQRLSVAPDVIGVLYTEPIKGST